MQVPNPTGPPGWPEEFIPIESEKALKIYLPLTLAVLGVSTVLAAHADTIGSTTVNATDSVYAAGGYASNASSFGGTAPIGIAIAPGVTSITFSGVTGLVTVNGGTLNDADGVGSVSGEINTGFMSLSGITTPTAGDITGVFVGAGGPSGTAPTALNFDGAGGTSFTSLSAAIDQVFFVGDGLTGDGTGTTQTFYVPTGATELYLGLSDACGYGPGGPSCYGDNSGTFSLNYDEAGSVTPPPPPPTVPEPSSLALLGTGVLAACGVLRNRFAKA
jgi:hypothetical protein